MSTNTNGLKINDRIKGTYHGEEFEGLVVSFCGGFVGVDLDTPIMVCGTERTDVGFYLYENLIDSIDPGAAVECDEFQGHVWAK